MLTDNQLTDLATLHLAAKQDGDTWDMLPLLRAVAQAAGADERMRLQPLLDELKHMADKGEMPDGDYCAVTVAMWAEDWLRKLRA